MIRIWCFHWGVPGWSLGGEPFCMWRKAQSKSKRDRNKEFTISLQFFSPLDWGYIVNICCCCWLVTKLGLTLLQPHGLYIVHQAPLSMGFSRQEYWSGLPSPPEDLAYFFFFLKKTLLGLPLISFPFQCCSQFRFIRWYLMLRFIRSMFGSFAFNFSFLFPSSLLIEFYFWLCTILICFPKSKP